MTEHGPRSITRMLEAVARGDRGALDELWERVKEELQVIAKGKLRRDRRPRPMDTTELVNETVVRIFGKKPVHFQSRKHFYCYAAKVMHHILVDQFNDDWIGPTPPGPRPPGGRSSTTFGALRECLEKLERFNERWASVIRLRFYAGRSVRQTAECLGVKDRTVESDWQIARAWLHRCVSKGDTSVSCGGARQ